MKLSKRRFLSLASVGAAAFVFGCGKDATAKARFAVTYRCRVEEAPVAGGLSRAASRGHRAPIYQPAEQRKTQWQFCLRRMPDPAIFILHKV